MFYVAPADGGNAAGLVAVVLTLGSFPKIGVPKLLFKFPAGTVPFDVTGDGQRFIKLALAAATASTPAPITVVLNWQAGLKR